MIFKYKKKYVTVLLFIIARSICIELGQEWHSADACDSWADMHATGLESLKLLFQIIKPIFSVLTYFEIKHF